MAMHMGIPTTADILIMVPVVLPGDAEVATTGMVIMTQESKCSKECLPKQKPSLNAEPSWISSTV